MENKSMETPTLDGYRKIEVNRPQFPLVLKWIDPEFQTIYINLGAADNATIINFMKDYPDEDDPQNEE